MKRSRSNTRIPQSSYGSHANSAGSSTSNLPVAAQRTTLLPKENSCRSTLFKPTSSSLRKAIPTSNKPPSTSNRAISAVKNTFTASRKPLNKPSTLSRRSSSTNNLNVPKVLVSAPLNLRRSNSSNSLYRTSGAPSDKPRGHFGRSNSSTNLHLPSNWLGQRTPQSVLKIRTPLSGSRQRSDKKVQAVEYEKVERFLLAKNPNIGHLKPPNLNTFINAMDILFKEIDSRISITKENFKEQIPKHLKAFEYPGTVGQSLFKTVSAMHSWPQILSIWSWLFELISILNNPEPYVHGGDTNEKLIKVKKLLTDFITNSYRNLHTNTDSAPFMKLKESLVSELGFNQLNIEFEEKTNQELQMKCDKLKTEEDHIIEEIETSESSVIRIKENIENYNESYNVMKETCKANIKSLKSENTDDKIINLKDSIKSLQDSIAQQPCTSEENSRLLTNIEDLEHKINMMNVCQLGLRENIEANGLKSKEAKRRVEAEILTINANITKLQFYRPEYDGLYLRKTVFVGPAMFKEINEVKKLKEEIKIIVQKDIIQKRSVVENLEKTKIDLVQSLHVMKNKKISLEDEEQKLKNILDKNSERLHKETTHLQEKIEKSTKEILAIRMKIEDLSVIREEYETKQKELASAENNLHEFQKQSMLFLANFWENKLPQSCELEEKMRVTNAGINDYNKRKTEGLTEMLGCLEETQAILSSI